MGEKIGLFVLAMLMIIVISILMAWPTQILWNTCLVPAVDGLNFIGFWQALGINVLCSILFKNSSSSSKE
jgi:hypothetical protein